jgi:NodT family efflux transporter outer membrane factor (OMF) lipoprotein
MILKLLNPVILLLLSFTTACTVVGPDYSEPDPKWLAKWQPQAFPKVSDEQHAHYHPQLEQWWTLFEDPVLNQLINQTYNNNPSLKIAALNIFQSRAALGLVRSSLYPQLQQLSGTSQYINQDYHGGNTTDSNRSYTSHQLGFDIGWELDFWGKFKRSIESADAAFFASISNQQAIQVLMSAQVVDAYYLYRTLQLRLLIAKENVSIQKRSLEITNNLFKGGEGSELDVQQAKTLYLATLSTIPELEIQLQKTENTLSLLLGQEPGNLKKRLQLPADYKIPVIPSTRFQVIPAKILMHRPDLRQAAWLVAAQSAQIGVAEADYYPAISLIGSIGWSSSTLSGSSDIFSINGGPAFQWSIFDYDRIDNNVRIQDAGLQQLIESYHNLAIKAAGEVDDASYSLLKTHERQKLLDESVLASRRALAIANTRYKEGYADFQRVLDAQKSFFIQSDNQLQNQQQQISAVVAIFKSLGGGWQPASTKDLLSEDTMNTMKNRVDWGNLLDYPLPDINSAPADGSKQ